MWYDAKPCGIPSRSTLRPPGCGVVGFSTLIRPALKHLAAVFVCRAQSPVYAPSEIRGKTGPAPIGALLFRPFSWAMQEKGQGNRGR